MDFRKNKQVFFASDLVDFLACRYLTGLERFAARGIVKRPRFDDPMLEILRQRGVEHERAYVRLLAESGKAIAEIDRESADPLSATVAAMRAGADVIVQARLEHGSWAGWADVLMRVRGKKLAR